MNRGSQVGHRDPIDVCQRNLDCRAFGQGFQILKNTAQQIMMFSAPGPPNVGQNDAVVFRKSLLGSSAGFFSHTHLVLLILLQSSIILIPYCQAFFIVC